MCAKAEDGAHTLMKGDKGVEVVKQLTNETLLIDRRDRNVKT